MTFSVLVRVATAGAWTLLGALLCAKPALAQPDLAPSPFPPVLEAAPVVREACPFIGGPRAGGFGPNSLVTVAGVVQPGVCWLELSLSLGLNTGEITAFGGSFDAHDPVDLMSEASYVSLTIPLGARFWFMGKHSVLGDAGFGFTRYLMSGDVQSTYGGDSYGKWDRPTTALVAYLGAGYGYRFAGAQAGPRVAAVVGAFVHLTELGDSTMLGPLHPSEVEELQDALDHESDVLTDLEPYIEISASFVY